jgi:arylsulfatase A-like enzyme
LVDVFPTILEMAGCEPKPDCFGKSLMPVISDPCLELHDAVFGEVHDRVMIRDERYKMVVDSSGAVLKLYDLVEDREESVNLVGQEELGPVISRLRHRLLDWYLGTQTRQRPDKVIPLS